MRHSCSLAHALAIGLLLGSTGLGQSGDSGAVPGPAGQAPEYPTSAQPLLPEGGQPGDSAEALQIPKGALGPEYVDASFGFGFRPIAGASMDRRKRTVEGRLQLAQFVRLDIGWSMAVRLWSSRRGVDVTAAKQAFGSDLVLQYPDAEITRAEELTVDARQAVRLAATFSAEGQTWLRQQAIIRLRPRDNIMVLLTTPEDDREVAAKTFDQILAGFRVVRTDLQQAQIDAALERGAALIQGVAASGTLLNEQTGEPAFFRLLTDGQPIGSVEIREGPAKIGGDEGLRILQHAWIFNPDGSAQFLEEDKFVAADLQYDEWRHLSQLMPSKQADPKQQVIFNVEAGIRTGDQLIVKYAGTGVDEKQDKAIEVESSYAPGAWPLLLPRLVDLSQPQTYAFSMYDSERRGMILRTFQVAGPAHALVQGRRVAGFKIEDSEGLLPPVNEVIVDNTGRLLRSSVGPMEMVATTPEQLEAEFGERVRATQKTFRENAGLPEPSAQPQAAPQQRRRSSGTPTPPPSPRRGTGRR